MILDAPINKRRYICQLISVGIAAKSTGRHVVNVDEFTHSGGSDVATQAPTCRPLTLVNEWQAQLEHLETGFSG